MSRVLTQLQIEDLGLDLSFRLKDSHFDLDLTMHYRPLNIHSNKQAFSFLSLSSGDFIVNSGTCNAINKTITYICTHHGETDGVRERIQLLDSLVNEAVLQSVGPVTNLDPAVFSLKIKGMWHLPLK